MQKLIGSPRSHYETPNGGRTAFNRTGAAILVGGCYFADEATSDADSTTVDLGFDGILKPTTTLITQHPPLLISKGTPGDNERGDFIEGEGVSCMALVNSTTDITKGDWLVPTNGQAYLVKATSAITVDEGGAVVHSFAYAKALETRTSDDTGLIRVRLHSFGRFV